jgi:uncharacterized repeat protein (TIGR01451 family)
MKRFYTLFRLRVVLLILFLPVITQDTQAQWVQVPDSSFRNAISALVPAAINGTMLDTTNVQITGMDSLNVANLGIHDLSGIQYFDSLRVLICKLNSLQSLPPLPSTLEVLNAFFNQLTTLPVLPSTLITIDVSNNNLVSLNALPSSLVTLNCSGNLLTSLPTFPQNLETLNADQNQLSSLPSLPQSVHFLYVNRNQLSTLPSLPVSLYKCEVSYNHLTSLPSIPSTVWWLHCDYNQLTVLPALQSGLQYLQCDSNFLSYLPVLPSSLIYLYCSYNQLTWLPAMGQMMSILNCSHNQISSMPSFGTGYNMQTLICGYNLLTVLPVFTNTAGFTTLYCEANQLTSLPPLAGLVRVNCSQNHLTSLPALPWNLTYLVDSANNIPCLPLLPDSLRYLWASNTGVTCLPNIPLNLVSTDVPTVVCGPGSACNPYPVISGSAYRDDNLNYLQDGTEIGNQNFKILIQPGNYILSADDTGNYFHSVDTGLAYTISVIPTRYYYSVPAQQTTPVMTWGMTDPLNDFAMQRVGIVHDLEAIITSRNSATRGFSVMYTLTVKNNGTVTDTATLKMFPDLLQNYVSANPAPAQVQTDSIIWNNIILVPGQTYNADVVMHISNSVPLGTLLNCRITTESFSQDTTPPDNKDSLQQVVVGSYDPNVKRILPEGDITPAQASAGQWMDYTICFQNTGSSPAINVEITDTISNNLLVQTFEIIASSHPFTWNITNGIANFKFSNIQLADSSTDEPASHGFIRYRMLADSNLISGDSILNNAHIYFDFNPAIITNTVKTMVQIPTSRTEVIGNHNDVKLLYNPAMNSVEIKSTNRCLHYNLIDITGKVLQENQVNNTNWTFDVTNLPQGIYFVSLYYEKEERVVRRFVKTGR